MDALKGCQQMMMLGLRLYRIVGKFGELTRFEHLAKESLAN